MLLSEFYRTKGAKDKKPRKKKAISEIAKGGLGGAVSTAGGVWTLGEALRAIPKTKKLSSSILEKGVPKAAWAGLAGGAALAAIRRARKKRKQQ